MTSAVLAEEIILAAHKYGLGGQLRVFIMREVAKHVTEAEATLQKKLTSRLRTITKKKRRGH